MSALAVDHVLRYPHASALDTDARLLRLATSNLGGREHPHFFAGDLVRPERTAQLLLGLMTIVQARFHVPPAMVARLVAESDPVVTSSDDRLRFEGFSACCGAYARVDLHPGAVLGERFGRGTTNVDFNPPMLAALATMRGPASLAVGSDGVTLKTLEGEVVEKKVALPVRWLKGFVEVQACQARMRPVLETTGPEAVRFLRGLPRMKTNRRATWVVRSGRSLRLTQVEPRGGDAVRVGGLERLRVLERLALDARAMHVFADDRTGATGWVVRFDDGAFHLLVSPEVWRGFSGEGGVLEALAGDGQDVLRRVQAQLGWSAVVEADALAARAAVAPHEAKGALAMLGTRGLVGFDLDAGGYFHRELPFDLTAVEKLHPRLAKARKLVEAGGVRFEKRSTAATEAFVKGTDVEHRVVITADDAKCTCPWYAKHRSERGPCRHVLAVRLVLEDDDDEVG